MKYIIFDIDGVLADSSEREKKYLIGKEKKDIDWQSYYSGALNDPHIESGVLTAKAFLVAYNLYFKQNIYGFWDYEIVFVTGREETVKMQTLQWLSDNLYIPIEKIKLFMRPVGKHTPNSKFKESIGEKLGFKNIALAFDDNRSTVDMWRSHGVKCFHTDDRDFK